MKNAKLTPEQRIEAETIKRGVSSALKLRSAATHEELHSMFYSMPWRDRKDEIAISGRLSLLRQALEAMDRGEVLDTFKHSSVLQSQVRDLEWLLQRLTSRANRGEVQ